MKQKPRYRTISIRQRKSFKVETTSQLFSATNIPTTQPHTHTHTPRRGTHAHSCQLSSPRPSSSSRLRVVVVVGMVVSGVGVRRRGVPRRQLGAAVANLIGQQRALVPRVQLLRNIKTERADRGESWITLYTIKRSSSKITGYGRDSWRGWLVFDTLGSHGD